MHSQPFEKSLRVTVPQAQLVEAAAKISVTDVLNPFHTHLHTRVGAIATASLFKYSCAASTNELTIVPPAICFACILQREGLPKSLFPWCMFIRRQFWSR